MTGNKKIRNTSAKRLTDTAIKNFRPAEKKNEKGEIEKNEKEVLLPDGEGLYLTFRPVFSTNRETGEKEIRAWAKTWTFRFMRPNDKKRTNTGFGNYPAVTLQLARELKRQAQELLAQGINPITNRASVAEQRLRDIEATTNTFRKNACDWYELHKSKVKPHTLQKAWERLELHIFPTLGDLPLAAIDIPLIRVALNGLEKEGKIETIEKLCISINQILDNSVDNKKLAANLCGRVRKQFPTKVVKNRPTIKAAELPKLMADIEATKGMDFITKTQFYWSLHTLVRPAESAGTRWDEIDSVNRLWTLPPARMKNARQLRVPLTDSAMAILDEMQKIRRNDYVFPFYSVKQNKPIAKDSVNQALRNIGYKDKLVSHGLRSLGSTTFNEAIKEDGQRRFDRDVIEVALSHCDKDQTRDDYNHAEYLPQRVVMMRWWSELIEAAKLVEVMEAAEA